MAQLGYNFVLYHVAPLEGFLCSFPSRLKAISTTSTDWTLGNFLKPLATINLPKSSTFLCNFSKGVKIYHVSSEIIFGQLLQTFGDSGHTGPKAYISYCPYGTWDVSQREHTQAKKNDFGFTGAESEPQRRGQDPRLDREQHHVRNLRPHEGDLVRLVAEVLKLFFGGILENLDFALS